jgi:hypothetical protein
VIIFFVKKGFPFSKSLGISALHIYRVGHSIMSCDIFAKFLELSNDDLVIILNKFFC